MADKPHASGSLARGVCELFPRRSNLQLARILHAEHPMIFPTVEAARGAVRYYRGASGPVHRRYKTEFVLREELPEPTADTWKRHTLPDGIKRWLILADLHGQFYDRNALTVALEYGRAKSTRCDGVLILGDLFDFYVNSTFEKNIEARDTAEELFMVAEILDVIKTVLKPKQFIFRAANHDFRLERYINRVAPEIAGLSRIEAGGKTTKLSKEDTASVLELPYLLDLKGRGIDWIPHQDPIDYRHLTFLHGDEWGQNSGGVSPARTALLRAGCCVCVAHSHRVSQQPFKLLNDESLIAKSIGCLCQLHPRFSSQNQWEHGFGVLVTGPTWSILNPRIVHGEVVL